MPEPRPASTPPMPSSRTSSVRTPSSCEAIKLDDVRVRVLGDVGERLGGDVVGGRLDRRRQPLVERHVDVDRDVGATCERPERRPEPGLGEDRGVDAARDLAQLVGDVLQAFRRALRRCPAVRPAVFASSRVRGR